MCMFCKCDSLKESKTTHVVNYKGCVIVINTDEVVAKLEVMVDYAKKMMQEVAVIDYAKGNIGKKYY